MKKIVSLALLLAACSGNPGPNTGLNMSTTPPSPDPRVGLSPGLYNAGVAAWNMHLVSLTPPGMEFAGVTNSDLAFLGNYAIQGNYNGYQIWNIADPKEPKLVKGFLCPASQSDVSVYRNLLFVSGEGLTGRLDCGTQGVPDTVSMERLRGLRIFDITDIRNPKNVGNVQTCRGSHTHTVVEDPNDKQNVYVYISGSAGVRSPSELAGCSRLTPDQDPNSALFRIEVIKVPLAHPEQAAVVSSPRIFNDLAAPARHGEAPSDQRQRPNAGGNNNPPRPRTGPNQCHDITVYPAIGYAGGACGGYGLLLDIHDVANPKRIYAAADSNFSFWHSATFSNDGRKVLFTDEWGGGTQPRCRSTDKYEWGADAVFTMEPNGTLQFQSYYKMPAAQTTRENCVAHNGNLIPIPGREVMVQGWYQGGVSVFDWTDPKHVREIAYYDRGPVDSAKLVTGGSWSAYWYNGHIYSSEIARGLDIFDLQPSGFLTQNEIDAAKTVHFDYQNVQGQQKIVWPTTFVLARAYVDQLARSGGLSSARVSAVRNTLNDAEKASGDKRREALNALASGLAAETSSDPEKMQLLVGVVKSLATM